MRGADGVGELLVILACSTLGEFGGERWLPSKAGRASLPSDYLNPAICG